MAKAKPIPDLTADVPYAEAAAKIVAVRGDELADHAQDVLDTGDIERVHDMRVATRRLRAALEIFEPCFPAKAYGQALTEVKRLADALGERRDRDVAIAALHGFNDQMAAPDRRGVASLIEQFRAEQEEANQGLAPLVSDERLRALGESMDELVGAAGGGRRVKARPVKKLEPSRSLGENAARIVKVRLDEMLDFAPRALGGKTKAQHDMRIAAKRLRYVLEVTGFCFGRPADTARRRARDLQDILGEIHDCDVMLPRVREHLEELQLSDAKAVRERAGRRRTSIPASPPRRLHRTAYRGLDVLAVYLEARRELLSDRFVAFWRRQEETGTWRRLERSVDGYLRRSREARRTARAAERARQEAAAAARAAEQAEARPRSSPRPRARQPRGGAAGGPPRADPAPNDSGAAPPNLTGGQVGR